MIKLIFIFQNYEKKVKRESCLNCVTPDKHGINVSCESRDIFPESVHDTKQTLGSTTLTAHLVLQDECVQTVQCSAKHSSHL